MVTAGRQKSQIVGTPFPCLFSAIARGAGRPTAYQSLNKDDRLEAGNLKAFPASRVFALNEIVAPQHVRPSFFKARAVPFIGRPAQSLLLRAHQPSDIVRCGLMAKEAGEVGRLQDFVFVKKLVLLHPTGILS